MADPFIGEIRIFAGNFAPRGWALCDGQLLPISQFTALFSILGTTYGGNGRTTLALPNLQGRFPMHPGRGPGLTPRSLGEKIGSPEVTLIPSQIPSHTHTQQASTDPGTTGTPSAEVILAAPAENDSVYGPPDDLVNLASEVVGNTGGGAPHENRQPYLAMNFIIALQGLFPSRS